MKNSDQYGQMIEFTNLEAAVLHLICEMDEFGLTDDQRGILRTQLSTAQVVERENTGHGFYTGIVVERSTARKLEGVVTREGHLNMVYGPIMMMEGLGDGNSMGFILWLEDGYAVTLEGFQKGDDAGQTVDLHNYDLTQLRFVIGRWT